LSCRPWRFDTNDKCRSREGDAPAAAFETDEAW
jgi:hypothetical protein